MDKPVEVLCLKSERHVIVIKDNETIYKIFQISFGKDGSLFVHFPYFSDSNGLASRVQLRAGLKYPVKNVSLTDSGKVTSHRIKFSHHPDGRTHFSQTGKIFTRVKKQAVPLEDINGHIFTVMLQGLTSFTVGGAKKDKHGWSEERSVVEFNVTGLKANAFKFVALWMPFDALGKSMDVVGAEKEKVGPKIIRRLGNNPSVGFLIGPPYGNPMDDYVLVVAIEPVDPIESNLDPTLLFMGGFDSVDVVNDLSKDTSVLTLMYPTKNTEELTKKIGSIDFDIKK